MRFAMKLMILQEIAAKKMATELELDRTAGVLEVNTTWYDLIKHHVTTSRDVITSPRDIITASRDFN